MSDTKNNGAESVSVGCKMPVEQRAASVKTYTGKLSKTNNLLSWR